MIKTFILDASCFDDDDLFCKKTAEVSEYRRKKIDSFLFRKDKNLSLGAAVLLNAGLAEYGLSEKNSEIYFGQNGKPYLKNEKNIFFNLSHSGIYVICSFSESEVGADIEQHCELDANMRQNLLPPYEETEIGFFQTDAEKENAFYRLWTLRESFSKFIGAGLSLSPKSFSISLKSGISIQQNITGKEIFFHEYSLSGYSAAVCAEENIFNDKLITIRKEELKL